MTNAALITNTAAIATNTPGNWLDMVDAYASTRSTYARALRAWTTYAAARGIAQDAPTIADVIAYKRHLSARYAPATVSSYLTALRRYTGVIAAETGNLQPVYAARAVKGAKRTKSPKQHLTASQAAALVEAATTPRDRAIISLMLRTGLRDVEVTRLRIGDLQPLETGNYRMYVHGKGHDTRDAYVILTARAYMDVAAYLTTRGPVSKSAPLFASESHNNKGGAMTTRAVSMIVRRALDAIGLDGKQYTAHSLRHTCAVQLLQAGASIDDVRTVLRHTSVATTEIYLQSIRDEQRAAICPESLLDTIY